MKLNSPNKAEDRLSYGRFTVHIKIHSDEIKKSTSKNIKSLKPHYLKPPCFNEQEKNEGGNMSDLLTVLKKCFADPTAF